MAGLALAVVVLGGGLAALILPLTIDRLRAGPAGPPTRAVVVPTLPPEWTPTPSATPAPAQTAMPVQEATRSPTLAPREVDLFALAQRQMWGQHYEAAIETWGKLIQAQPEDHQAYYGRALSYLRLTDGLGFRGEFIGFSQAALSDVERAIALSPQPSGDYYLARSWAFENLGLAAYYRVDRERLIEVALENMRVGISLPHSEPLVSYHPVGLLLQLGRCDEALREAQQLDRERGSGLAPSPLLNYYRGVALICTGQHQQALEALLVAREAFGDCEYDYQQAVAQYHLGRIEEALRKINSILTGCPTYDGYRYYLRALIQYELGDPESATRDLERGSLEAWDWRGLKAYVEARILADEGKRQEAIERMQLAELTFERTRGPFLERIRRELAALGGRPLDRTPVPSPRATPIAPLPADHPTPPRPLRILHNRGSGAIEIAPGETLMLHFRGPAGFSYSKAHTLDIYLVPPVTPAGSQLQIHMQLFDPNRHWWEEFRPRWGGNSISAPDRFFYGSGDLFVRLHNPGLESLAIADVGLELAVIDDFGQQVSWSFLEG